MSTPCGICTNPLKFSVVELPCGHSFCPDCIKKDLMRQMKEDQEAFKCPNKEKCQKIIEEDILEEILDKKTFDKFKNRKMCDGCEKEKGTPISCGHKFCQSCMKAEIRQQFKKDDLNAFCCPKCKGIKEIDGEEIQKIVGEKWLESYYMKCKGCKTLIPIASTVELTRCSHKMCKNCNKECEERKKCKKCNKRTKKKNGVDEYKCKFCKKYLEEINELDCKHKICKYCLTVYFEKMMKMKIPIFICPKYDCEMIISHEIFQNGLQDQTLNKYINYKKSLKNSDNNRNAFEKEITEEEEEKLNEKKPDMLSKTPFDNKKESEKSEKSNERPDTFLIKRDSKGNNEKEEFLEKTPKKPEDVETTIASKKFKDASDKIKTFPEIFCLRCKEHNKTSNLINFNCNHVICLKCMTERLNNRIKENDVYESIMKCPSDECDKVLSLEILKPYLELDLYLLLEKKKNAVPLKRAQPFEPTIEIKCFMCKKLTSLDKILTMSCDHKFCMNCFQEDCISKITEGRFKELSCFQCKQELDYQILANNVPQEIFQKYDEYLMKKAQAQIYHQDRGWVKDLNSKIRECPSCKASNEIDLTKTYFYCKTCFKAFCSKDNCLGEWNDHSYKSCEDYRKFMENLIICPACKKKVSSSYGNQNAYCFNHTPSMIFCVRCKKQIDNASYHKC